MRKTADETLAPQPTKLKNDYYFILYTHFSLRTHIIIFHRHHHCTHIQPKIFSMHAKIGPQKLKWHKTTKIFDSIYFVFFKENYENISVHCNGQTHRWRRVSTSIPIYECFVAVLLHFADVHHLSWKTCIPFFDEHRTSVRMISIFVY